MLTLDDIHVGKKSGGWGWGDLIGQADKPVLTP